MSNRSTGADRMIGGVSSEHPLAPGTWTGIGSLPHRDRDAAVAFALSATPDLPAVPTLPVADPREGMLAQAAWGIEGVSVAADGRLEVNPAALDPEAPLGDPALEGPPFATLRSFLAAVAGRTGPIKVQIAGPVTLGLALRAQGAPDGVAFRTAAGAVRARAGQMVAAVRAAAPDAALVAVLDEPGLVAATPGRSGLGPLGAEDVIDLMSSGLAAFEPYAMTGVHCCGPTDWRLVIQAGPKLLSLPVDVPVDAAEGALTAFVERGGWIAWGAVPTDRPLGESASRLWRVLSSRWCGLVQSGCDPWLLRRQAVVTPACGLASHSEAQAERVLGLAREVADRLHDQVVGIRLSVGA
ncbi:MAG: hypothetical protein HYX34_06320 [Actinobacteria bacterium]|nr:hypothetical protein [Actinomycetota bacterium]